MKHFYITTVEVFERHKDNFHPQKHAHYIDLGDGNILLGGVWPESDEMREAWEAEEGVHVLPRTLSEGTKALDAEHVEMLGKHPELGCCHGDTILTLCKKAAKIHPKLKVSDL